MKTNQILKYIVFALVAGVVLESCKDNVIVPVANNKPLDSLNQLIATLNKSLVTINKGDASIKITTAQYKSKKDSIDLASSATPAVKVQYTVYILDGSTSVVSCNSCRAGKGDVPKMQSLDGATVVLNSGGNTYTATSADGRAIFDNVAVGGLATISISASGYTSVTYTTLMYNPYYYSTAGITSNVSSTIMLLPTTGSNVVTYSGQIYINKSVADDTLGNKYLDPNDTKNYGTFVSAPGGYIGENFTSYDFSNYVQNVYSGYPTSTAIKWDQATNWAGQANIFAYPTWVVDYYGTDPDYTPVGTNDDYTPGDPIEITITGLTAFATVSATGSYTVAVPAYANNPGVSFGWSQGFEDDYTYLVPASVGSDTIAYSAKKVVTSYTDKKLHNTNWTSGYNTTTKGYALNSSSVWYSITGKFWYRPYAAGPNGVVDRLDQNSDFTNAHGVYGTIRYPGLPGQTYTKNIYMFAAYRATN